MYCLTLITRKPDIRQNRQINIALIAYTPQKLHVLLKLDNGSYKSIKG